MTMDYYAVVMAGGSGTRLWPLSRKERPKQLLNLGRDRSLYQLAIDRIAPVFKYENIIVITAGSMVNELINQTPNIPSENFLVEPEGKGTAPAIALGAMYAEHLSGGKAVIACLTADHIITDVNEFQKVLLEAGRLAHNNRVVTLGISPTFGSTGYGYIQRGKLSEDKSDFSVYSVKKFKEKPSQNVADNMANDTEHYWNSGMFIWSTQKVMEEFERQLPNTYSALRLVENLFDGDDIENRFRSIWLDIEYNTIDYGIMEDADDVCVMEVDIGWSDVGSWLSVLNNGDTDEFGNVVLGGDHYNIDSKNTLVHSDKLVVTIGTDKLVVVDVGDVLLVCRSDRSEEVKRVIEYLKENNKESLL